MHIFRSHLCFSSHTADSHLAPNSKSAGWRMCTRVSQLCKFPGPCSSLGPLPPRSPINGPGWPKLKKMDWHFAGARPNGSNFRHGRNSSRPSLRVPAMMVSHSSLVTLSRSFNASWQARCPTSDSQSSEPPGWPPAIETSSGTRPRTRPNHFRPVAAPLSGLSRSLHAPVASSWLAHWGM